MIHGLTKESRRGGSAKGSGGSSPQEWCDSLVGTLATSVLPVHLAEE